MRPTGGSAVGTGCGALGLRGLLIGARANRPRHGDATTSTTASPDASGQVDAPDAVPRRITVDGQMIDGAHPARGVLRARQRNPIERIGAAPLVVTPFGTAAATLNASATDG